jgi:hypothetical protein
MPRWKSPIQTKNCIICGVEFGREKLSFARRKCCGAACAHKAIRKDPEQAFWAKVNKNAPSGCWEWTASRKEKGYGQFYSRGKMHRAHRLAWKLLRGDPGPLEVAHRCDNRICVNPEHLFLATHDENMADCKAKGRQARGERSGKGRLTEKDVLELRQRRKEGWTKDQLAGEYKITPHYAYQIYTGRTWKHLPT